MPSHLSKEMTKYSFGTASAVLFLLLCCSFVSRLAPVERFILHKMSSAFQTFQTQIASSKLMRLEQQNSRDKDLLATTIAQHQQLLDKANDLAELRDEVLSQREHIHGQLALLDEALRTEPNSETVQVADRVYRRRDIAARALELKEIHQSLTQETKRIEHAISHLSNDVRELVNKITQAQQQVDSHQRNLKLARYHLESEKVRTKLAESLERLEHPHP